MEHEVGMNYYKPFSTFLLREKKRKKSSAFFNDPILSENRFVRARFCLCISRRDLFISESSNAAAFPALARREEDGTEASCSCMGWSNRDDSIASVRSSATIFPPSCFLYPGWYRFHGITAINYEGGRPKGNVVGEGRGGAGERERKKERTRAKERRAGLEKEKRRVQLALHTISTWSSAAAAVSLRENKVSLPARALALALARAREREAKGARG